MMWLGWGGGSWVAWLVMSAILVFWVLVISRLVRAARATKGAASKPDPRAILEGRFARGEIDAREVEARRTVLLRRDQTR